MRIRGEKPGWQIGCTGVGLAARGCLVMAAHATIPYVSDDDGVFNTFFTLDGSGHSVSVQDGSAD